MGRNNDEAVLLAIGQITDKMDYDDPKHIEFILEKISNSREFMDSAYGRKFIEKLNVKLKKLMEDHVYQIDDLIRQSDEKTENLFRDIDDSLLQLASQRTSRKIQKLLWVVLGFSVINTIVVFSVALYVWNLNM